MNRIVHNVQFNSEYSIDNCQNVSRRQNSVQPHKMCISCFGRWAHLFWSNWKLAAGHYPGNSFAVTITNMISTVNLFRSCVVVVTRTITKPSIIKSHARQIRSVELSWRFISNMTTNTMRPQVFLTRSDFPVAGLDLLQNE